LGLRLHVGVYGQRPKHLLRAKVRFRLGKSGYEIFRIKVVQVLLVVGKWIVEDVREGCGSVPYIRDCREYSENLTNLLIDSTYIVIVLCGVYRGLITLIVDQQSLYLSPYCRWASSYESVKCFES